MKNVFFICLIAFCFQGAFAQSNPLGEFNRYVAENWKGEYQRVGQYRVKGTPYLFGESFPGKVILEDGTVSTKDKVLYDLFSQLAGPDSKGSIFLTDKKVNEFVLNLPQKFGGQSLLFKHSRLYNDEGANIYLNIITEGSKVDFLKVYKIRLLPDPSNMYDKELRIYDQYFDYYIYRHNDQKLVKMRLTKKNFTKELSSIPNADKIISSNDFDFSSESDISKLIFAINQ